VAPLAAHADNAVIDGDGVTPVNIVTSVDLGSVCVGATGTKDVGIAAQRKGGQGPDGSGNSQVWANGAQLTATTTSPGATVDVNHSSFDLPSNWVSSDNGATAGVATVRVSATPTSVGPLTGTVTITLSGTSSQASQTTTRSADLTWIATGVDCAPAKDTTDPVIRWVSTTPAANAQGWNNGPVTVTWSCEDAGGVLAATVSQTLSSEGANQSATGICTDAAGNTASDKVSGINIDLTKPTIGGSRSPAPNGNGWNNGAVTVTWTCADSLSGALADAVSTTLSAEGAGQWRTGTCADQAGNTAFDTVSGINIDLTAPTISGIPSPAPNGNGWNNGAVTVTWTCSDALSGVVSDTVTTTLGAEGADQSATGTCEDKAGNTASKTLGDINIDLTAPALNISGPASGASINLCTAGALDRPSFAPSDALSGLAGSSDSWSQPTTASGVGNYSYTASATDNAGNNTSQSRNYTVAYGAAFGGFSQPINADGLSRFKLGSTIPVKFQLTCNGSPISTAVAKLYVSRADTSPDAGFDEAISTSAATSGNLFRFSDSQYIFNLSTKAGYTNPGSGTATAFSAGSWRLTVGLDDGSTRSINVQIVK
jgi:hypothetical protein